MMILLASMVLLGTTAVHGGAKANADWWERVRDATHADGHTGFREWADGALSDRQVQEALLVNLEAVSAISAADHSANLAKTSVLPTDPDRALLSAALSLLFDDPEFATAWDSGDMVTRVRAVLAAESCSAQDDAATSGSSEASATSSPDECSVAYTFLVIGAAVAAYACSIPPTLQVPPDLDAIEGCFEDFEQVIEAGGFAFTTCFQLWAFTVLFGSGNPMDPWCNAVRISLGQQPCGCACGPSLPLPTPPPPPMQLDV